MGLNHLVTHRYALHSQRCSPHEPGQPGKDPSSQQAAVTFHLLLRLCFLHTSGCPSLGALSLGGAEPASSLPSKAQSERSRSGQGRTFSSSSLRLHSWKNGPFGCGQNQRRGHTACPRLEMQETNGTQHCRA